MNIIVENPEAINIRRQDPRNDMMLIVTADCISLHFQEKTFVVNDTEKEIWIRETLPEDKREGLRMYRFVRRIKKSIGKEEESK